MENLRKNRFPLEVILLVHLGGKQYHEKAPLYGSLESLNLNALARAIVMRRETHSSPVQRLALWTCCEDAISEITLQPESLPLGLRRSPDKGQPNTASLPPQNLAPKPQQLNLLRSVCLDIQR